MLFALDLPDPGSFASGAGTVGLVTVLFNGLVFLLTRKDKRDESNAATYKALLDEERKECAEKLNIQGQEIRNLARQVARLRRRSYAQEGRIEYLGARCEDAGMKLAPWTPPPDLEDDDDTPADGSKTHTALPPR